MYDQGLGNEMLKPRVVLRAPRARIAEIKDLMAREWGVTVADLESQSRKKAYSQPRQIAMSLCYELTGQSYPAIGKHFGGRDHTTVLFAHRKVQALEAQGRRFAEQMAGYRGAIAAIVAQRSPPVPVVVSMLAADVAEANEVLAPRMSLRWAERHKRTKPGYIAWGGLGGEIELAQ